MSYLEIPNFKDYIVNWFCGSYRTLVFVDGDENHLHIMYTISNRFVIRDDAKLQVTIARVLKLLCPPLITGIDYLKEEASCILEVNILSTSADQIKCEYDLRVCQGSVTEKFLLKKEELLRASNIMSHLLGFTVSESIFYIDIAKCTICKDLEIKTIKNVFFSGNKCIIEK